MPRSWQMRRSSVTLGLRTTRSRSHVVQDQQFVDAQPALVAGVAALVAARALVDLVRLEAVRSSRNSRISGSAGFTVPCNRRRCCRTSRWASTPLTAALIRIRLDADVDQPRDAEPGRRWCAAWRAPGGRSGRPGRRCGRSPASRISPSMITSGSCRSRLRRAAAKVMPIVSWTWIWLAKPAGIRPGLRRWRCSACRRRCSRRHEYSVVVLPLPVGPVTRMMPCGWSICFAEVTSCRRQKPRFSRPTMMERLSRMRMTHLLAVRAWAAC